MLSIRNLSKTFPGGKKAVDGVNLEIQSGDIYGFIGHNGAGKTTTIKCVTGIYPFDEGEILIDGISIKDDPISCKRLFAYIPDNPDLYEHLTGLQYLNFIADIFDVPKDVRMQRITSYAREFEIYSRLGESIGAYSHGMKQKLAILSALIHQPKLLILDEPFVGLDPKASYTLKQILSQLCQNGSAVFFSTHVLEVAEKICNKIAIIKDGRIITSGETQAVKGEESLEEVFLELIDHE